MPKKKKGNKQKGDKPKKGREESRDYDKMFWENIDDVLQTKDRKIAELQGKFKDSQGEVKEAKQEFKEREKQLKKEIEEARKESKKREKELKKEIEEARKEIKKREKELKKEIEEANKESNDDDDDEKGKKKKGKGKDKVDKDKKEEKRNKDKTSEDKKKEKTDTEESGKYKKEEDEEENRSFNETTISERIHRVENRSDEKLAKMYAKIKKLEEMINMGEDWNILETQTNASEASIKNLKNILETQTNASEASIKNLKNILETQTNASEASIKTLKKIRERQSDLEGKNGINDRRIEQLESENAKLKEMLRQKEEVIQRVKMSVEEMNSDDNDEFYVQYSGTNRSSNNSTERYPKEFADAWSDRKFKK